MNNNEREERARKTGETSLLLWHLHPCPFSATKHQFEKLCLTFLNYSLSFTVYNSCSLVPDPLVRSLAFPPCRSSSGQPCTALKACQHPPRVRLRLKKSSPSSLDKVHLPLPSIERRKLTGGRHTLSTSHRKASFAAAGH